MTMTENVSGKRSIIGGIVDDFKALSTKQIVAIVVAIAIALILEVSGLLIFGCFGILLIAVVLYMIPHLVRVGSVKVKTIMCVVFAILSVISGTFIMSPPDNDAFNQESDDKSITDMSISYDEATETYSISLTADPAIVEAKDDWHVKVVYGNISEIGFGIPQAPSTSNSETITLADMEKVGSVYKCTTTLPDMKDGFIVNIMVAIEWNESEEGEDPYYIVRSGDSIASGYYDSGISNSDARSIFFKGAAIITAEIVALFMIILLFSFFMRRSAEKTRDKMEAEGRLYPKGYGLCKKCGATVLPGEVVCRKCGEYIDVPDEMRAQKKDFFTCSECGAEVPSDAKVCPKCGSSFDEEVVVEVAHPDGSVDATVDTVTCPHCNEQIPANADWCPKCGKKIKG